MRNREFLFYLFLFSILLYVVVYEPVQGYYQDYMKQSHISQAKNRAMADYERSLDSLEVMTEKFYEKLLSADELIDFGYRLAELSEKTGLAASEITYKEVKDGGKVRVMRFIFTISGAYNRVRNFLAKVEMTYPFMIIDSIDRIAHSASDSSVTIKFEGGLLIKK